MGLLLLLGSVLPLKQFTAMGRLLRHITAQRDNFHKKGKKGKENKNFRATRSEVFLYWFSAYTATASLTEISAERWVQMSHICT